ncbi:MAG: hypothetical protein QOF21_1255 [Actinomycetota bacterium]|jgi:acyl-CoA thioesterase
MSVVYPRAADLALVPLEIEETANGAVGRFTLTSKLARPDGALFGGTAIAASVTLMEVASDAPALWATTQYVASATIGEELEVESVVVAKGKLIRQIQVTGRVGDRLVFSTLGSTALPRDGGLEGQFVTMPEVASPDDGTPFRPGPPGLKTDSGFTRVSEFRQVTLAQEDKRTLGSLALWARMADGSNASPAVLSYLADMSPIAVVRGAGKVGGGTSLDNSVRFGPEAETDWVLLEMHGHLAFGGYGHSSLHIWSPDGVLLAYGGQTSNMRHVWDEKDLPEEFRTMLAKG